MAYAWLDNPQPITLKPPFHFVVLPHNYPHGYEHKGQIRVG